MMHEMRQEEQFQTSHCFFKKAPYELKASAPGVPPVLVDDVMNFMNLDVVFLRDQFFLSTLAFFSTSLELI